MRKRSAGKGDLVLAEDAALAEEVLFEKEAVRATEVAQVDRSTEKLVKSQERERSVLSTGRGVCPSP